VDVSETLARAARTLIRSARQRKLGLRSVDALHLASAQLYGCERIFTYEDEPRRARWSELTGLPVEEPSVAQQQLL
jgi:predicted nucleic acid-binding protein